MSDIISEYLCKFLYNKLFSGYCVYRITKPSLSILDHIQSDNLVCKVDQEIKHRKLSALIKLNIDKSQCKDFINELPYKRFLVEEYINIEKEYYLMIESKRECDYLYFSENGGIMFTDLDSCRKLVLPIMANTSDISELTTLFFDDILIQQTVNNLIFMYRTYHFKYMEINPLVLSNNKIIPLDFAVKYDTCSLYLWPKEDASLLESDSISILDNKYEVEKLIDDIDKKTGASFKFTLLNENGSIWTLLSGGGASVLFTDAIFNMGLGLELGNYGEYSGNPEESYVYEYTRLVFLTMFKSNTDKDMVLIVGGGISNFTYIDKTFSGILKAIDDYSDKFIKHKIKIVVRRGGLNYKKGLQMFKDKCNIFGIDVSCFGPEFHITGSIKQYLRNNLKCDNEYICDTKEPTLDNISFPINLNHYLPFYTTKSYIIIINYQPKVVQRILDYDYLCERDDPSVIAIVHPQKQNTYESFFWKDKEILIPIVATLNDACKLNKDATVVVNYASFRSAYRTSMEVLVHKQTQVLVIISEGIAEQETRQLIQYAKHNKKTIIGPATVGGLQIGGLRLGNTCGSLDNIIEHLLIKPGKIALVTRSGGLLNELCSIITKLTSGIREAISIGGDRYPGTTFLDHILRFNKDENISLICLLGEVGGTLELEVAEAVKSKLIDKPIIAWCIGTSGEKLNKKIQFGHAGSYADTIYETASFKNYYMKKSGIMVPATFENIESLFISEATRLNILKLSKDEDQNIKDKYITNILNRQKTDFFSSISNETNNSLTYNNVSIENITSEQYSIGYTIGQLIFKKSFPIYLCNFIELVLTLLADHGIAVSSAHNTAVCSRSGQNISASVASGILCIHEKHGGAIHDAAVHFYKAKYKDNLSPQEYVDMMKKHQKYIPGIGHMYHNSTTNKDIRLKIMNEGVDIEDKDLVKYALEVEEIVLKKKDNLILNVDGFVAVYLLSSLMLEYGSAYVEEILDLQCLNSIFIIARTIGLCATYTDQHRLKQNLYRHPMSRITYI